ncbi:hypothetical protein [Paractinoplanes maris]|uniref:hypothetical protein n=1 Tax=Paractinoplanes maris TaxID=1734446 RepID=UPI0020218A74|nr:hypothetical protein [Actinoplanes maris]
MTALVITVLRFVAAGMRILDATDQTRNAETRRTFTALQGLLWLRHVERRMCFRIAGTHASLPAETSAPGASALFQSVRHRPSSGGIVIVGDLTQMTVAPHGVSPTVREAAQQLRRPPTRPVFP